MDKFHHIWFQHHLICYFKGPWSKLLMKFIYLNSTNFISKRWCKKVNSESRDFFFMNFVPNTPFNTHISINPLIITKKIKLFYFDFSFSAVRNKPQKAFFPFWWLFTSYIVMGNSYWRVWPTKNPSESLDQYLGDVLKHWDERHYKIRSVFLTCTLTLIFTFELGLLADFPVSVPI